jgi:hypothetical protein
VEGGRGGPTGRDISVLFTCVVVAVQKLTHPLFNIGVDVVQKAHAYFEPVERSPTNATGDDLNSVDS